MSRGYIDLHAHWVPGIDDGVPTAAEGRELLRGLAAIGFDRAVATPHMRPGMFDNARAVIEGAFARFVAGCEGVDGLPRLDVACEHYLDDTVYQRLLAGHGVPLPGGQAVLVELHAEIFPVRLADRVIDLRRRKLRPVLAHPERYAAVADKPSILDPSLEAGVALQLDVAGGAATVEHHVGDQVDGQLQVAVEHVRVVAGVLPGGERV